MLVDWLDLPRLDGIVVAQHSKASPFAIFQERAILFLAGLRSGFAWGSEDFENGRRNQRAGWCMSGSGGGCSVTVSASIQNTRTWGPRFLGNNLEFDQGQHQPLRGIGSFLKNSASKVSAGPDNTQAHRALADSQLRAARRLQISPFPCSFSIFVFPCFSRFSFFGQSAQKHRTSPVNLLIAP